MSDQMSDQLRDERTAAAPLTDADVDGLIPTFVATHADLNVAEQANIEAAARWAFGRRRVTTPEQLLTIEFSDRVHRRMFGDVWRWAGQQRTVRGDTDVDPHRIAPRMKVLFDDARYWHERDMFSPSERAIRLHHQLIRVHPYRRGNHRHARFMGDLYLHLIGVRRLAWGVAHAIGTVEATRRADLTALQKALDAATRTPGSDKLKSALDEAMRPPDAPRRRSR